MPVAQAADPRRERIPAHDAAELARRAEMLISSRGRTSIRFDMRTAAPPETELRRAIVGPTGCLRAPSAQVGTTLLVGFSEPAWAAVIGIAGGARPRRRGV